MLDLRRKCQSPQKVSQVIGQHEKGQPHPVRDEPLTGQPRPVQGILALLDPLLGRTASVVEMDHALVPGAHVGHDKPDSRKKLTLMPFDLCDDPARSIPACRLIHKIVVPDDGLFRRPAHRTGQKKADPILQNIIGGKAPLERGAKNLAQTPMRQGILAVFTGIPYGISRESRPWA